MGFTSQSFISSEPLLNRDTEVLGLTKTQQIRINIERKQKPKVVQVHPRIQALSDYLPLSTPDFFGA
jgi:hypothetical protein